MIPFTFSQVYEGVVSVTRAFSARVFRLLKPVSIDEDLYRQEYILNIILTISICLLSVLEATILYNFFTIDSNSYDGFRPITFGLLVLLCVGLLIASKSGFVRYSSYILIALYVAGTLYSGWTWGVSLPATLLAAGLIVLTSSILIGSTFGFAMGGCMVVALIVLGIHERESLGVPFWHLERISYTDLISYSSILLFMTYITWFSNKEIDRSLERARKSEKLLEAERNSLEKKVAVRARELVTIEDARMRELEKSAEFGRISQGLFHDLMIPLSSISLYMERLAQNDNESRKQCLDSIQKMIGVSRRMNSFMDNLKQYIRGIQSIQTDETVDLVKEIDMIKDILSYKARMSHVKIRYEIPNAIVMRVDQTRIHQILINLLSNAIEACDGYERPLGDEHIVTLHVTRGEDTKAATISISDTGRGISPNHMSQLFKKPFTTKEHGTGNGLMTIAHIVEKELHGSISVTGGLGIGSTFTINLPNVIIPSISPSPPSQNDTHRTKASAMTSDTAGHP